MKKITLILSIALALAGCTQTNNPAGPSVSSVAESSSAATVSSIAASSSSVTDTLSSTTVVSSSILQELSSSSVSVMVSSSSATVVSSSSVAPVSFNQDSAIAAVDSVFRAIVASGCSGMIQVPDGGSTISGTCRVVGKGYTANIAGMSGNAYHNIVDARNTHLVTGPVQSSINWNKTIIDSLTVCDHNTMLSGICNGDYNDALGCGLLPAGHSCLAAGAYAN